MPIDPNGVPDADAATRLRGHRRGLRHRRGLMLTGAVGIPALAFVLWWFQPQALLFDDVVDEGFPVGASADPAGDDSGDDVAGREPTDGAESAASGTGSAHEDQDSEVGTTGRNERGPADAGQGSTGPVELAAGSFVSRNRYTVTGTATNYQLEDGQRILRFEDFESTNGPDLFVYLTVAGTADDDAALEADFIDLGVLTGNIGNQNYVIPPEVDLDRYTSVAIWCRRFTTSFGVADLS